MFENFQFGLFDTFDWIQLSALLICTVEMVFIAVYFNDYGKPTGMYVSDILFKVVPYKVMMTVFVVFQTMFSLMFAFRFYNHMKIYFLSMTFAVVSCLCGWITLNFKYNTDEGVVSDTHKGGTLLFMIGSAAYFMLLIFMIRKNIMSACQLEVKHIISILILILTILCIVFSLIFISALMNGGTDAWKYEHSAFLALVIAHIFFFFLESPNPWRPIEHIRSEIYKVSKTDPEKVTLIDKTEITPDDVRRH